MTLNNSNAPMKSLTFYYHIPIKNPKHYFQCIEQTVHLASSHMKPGARREKTG